MAQRKETPTPPPSLENLTREQSEALEKAAFLIISAQQKAKKKAKAMLARARIPDDWFGSPCTAHIEGHGQCPCRDYEGDGGPCERKVTIDPVAVPIPRDPCGHKASKHLST
jgi:Family of unknown function (DUF6422)